MSSTYLNIGNLALILQQTRLTHFPIQAINENTIETLENNIYLIYYNHQYTQLPPEVSQMSLS